MCPHEKSKPPPFKILFKVQDVIRDSKLHGHTASIPEIVQGAAPAVVAPELHRETDDLLSTLLKKTGGSQRIHAAAHSNSNHPQNPFKTFLIASDARTLQ